MHEFSRRFNGKRSKWTLTFEEVCALGRAEGFEVVRRAWISRFFSGHRYVLMQRRRFDPAATAARCSVVQAMLL
jgi:hypothetical protein